MQTGNIILVAPTPATAATVQINYIKEPPNFTSTNNTSTTSRDYVSWCINRAFSFLKGPDNLYNLYQKKYTEEVQNFALQQMGRRRRGEYDDGVPRIVVPSPSQTNNLKEAKWQ